MSRLLEWVEVTPIHQKVLLVGLFLGLLGVGLYGVIVEPLAAEIKILRGELQALDRKLKLDTPSTNRVSDAQGELSQWTLIVSQQESRLGLDVPMSQVLSDVSHIADQTGILLSLWKPKHGVFEPSSQLNIRYLRLHLEGGYHHIAQFLNHMQFLPKVMGVVALTMDRIETSSGAPAIRAVVDLMGYDGNDQTVVGEVSSPRVAEHMVSRG